MAIFPTHANLQAALPARQSDSLRVATDALEAEFLTEMLKAAGLGKPSEGFGGGIGEEQFASFLRRAQATEIVRHGGIDLSESIFQSLTRRTRDASQQTA